MKDDYLWDGSGEPDPEVQKLENLLGRYRHDKPAPSFESIPEIAPVKQRWGFFRLKFVAPLSAVTAVLVVAALFFYLRPRYAVTPGSAWEVARIAGAPRVGRETIRSDSQTGMLGVGQTLVTDKASRASLTLDETGRIEVGPDSSLRLIASGRKRKLLSLERGTIHATIWAPPGEFVVDTPSAVAVDLGCIYTLHVDDSGAGLLRTTMGWVGFKLKGHESFIPAGAVCATRPKIGPGTPYFEDASAAFREALTKFDFAATTAQEREALLGILLVDARKRDALTLWHLLSRVSDEDLRGVYDRLTSLAPPPKDVTREGILRLDQKMLDSWWNSLGYGDVYLWHMYERTWAQSPPAAN